MNTTLYVRMGGDLKEDRIHQVFRFYGRLRRCCLVRPRSETRKRTAFVEFDNRRDAENARRSLRDTIIDGVPISLFWAREGPRDGWVDASRLPAGVTKQRSPQADRRYEPTSG